MGGIGRIYFTAIDRYATRYCIGGAEFGVFRELLTAMDDEYLAWLAERRKADEAERKKGR